MKNETEDNTDSRPEARAVKIPVQRLVMPTDALRPCRKYRIASGNEFRLFREFDPNTECFQRISDGMLHFGREFIGFRNGERIVELVEV